MSDVSQNAKRIKSLSIYYSETNILSRSNHIQNHYSSTPSAEQCSYLMGDSEESARDKTKSSGFGYQFSG